MNDSSCYNKYVTTTDTIYINTGIVQSDRHFMLLFRSLIVDTNFHVDTPSRFFSNQSEFTKKNDVIIMYGKTRTNNILTKYQARANSKSEVNIIIIPILIQIGNTQPHKIEWQRRDRFIHQKRAYFPSDLSGRELNLEA